MRVMVIVKATKESEAGALPDERLLTEMGNYNEELVKAGIMVAGEGLHPSSKGKRVRFSGTKPHRRRRPVRRDQGAHRRLLDVAGQVDGRSRRVAEEMPQPAQRGVRGGNPAGVRGRRLRRGVHAGAPRTGTAASRRDGSAAEALSPSPSDYTPAFFRTACVVSSPSLAASSAAMSFGIRPRGSGLTPS